MKQPLMTWICIQGAVCGIQTVNACLAGWDALQLAGTVFCWAVLAALVYKRAVTVRA